jgi:hypothetical protein
MLATKRKPAPTTDLVGEILKLRGQIEAFIDAKVAEIKASRDGGSLPADVIRLHLTHNSGCWCQIALNVLADK